MRALLVTALLLAAGAAEARAHGTTQSPASRNYVCRFLDRESGPCAYAWEANPQALYDWMGVLVPDADGQHRRHVPDGQLCSAGDAKFGALSRAVGGWLATELRPGMQTWKWTLNAPHATAYYRFYITRDGYDPGQALRWGDLEKIHDSGPRDAAKVERFRVDVPQRAGRHVVYSVWQRSDSPEAFYACSDVIFGAAGDVPFDPPGPDEGLNQPGAGAPGPAPAAPGKATRKGIRLRRKVDEDWGGGYCATVTVTNRSRKTRTWKGSLPFADTVTGLWNAKHRVRGGRLRVRGESYNAVLAPKAKTTFGYCATR